MAEFFSAASTATLECGGEDLKLNVRSRCPNCGEQALVHLVYGFPNGWLIPQADEGEVALGGCVITGDDLRYRCRKCESEVWRNGRHALARRARAFGHQRRRRLDDFSSVRRPRWR